jgi:hypothetical protein
MELVCSSGWLSFLIWLHDPDLRNPPFGKFYVILMMGKNVNTPISIVKFSIASGILANAPAVTTQRLPKS